MQTKKPAKLKHFFLQRYKIFFFNKSCKMNTYTEKYRILAVYFRFFTE